MYADEVNRKPSARLRDLLRDLELRDLEKIEIGEFRKRD